MGLESLALHTLALPGAEAVFVGKRAGGGSLSVVLAVRVAFSKALDGQSVVVHLAVHQRLEGDLG